MPENAQFILIDLYFGANSIHLCLAIENKGREKEIRNINGKNRIVNPPMRSNLINMDGQNGVKGRKSLAMIKNFREASKP